MFKTRLCRGFMAGRCMYGENCTFAHGVGELRPKRVLLELPEDPWNCNLALCRSSNHVSTVVLDSPQCEVDIDISTMPLHDLAGYCRAMFRAARDSPGGMRVTMRVADVGIAAAELARLGVLPRVDRDRGLVTFSI